MAKGKKLLLTALSVALVAIIAVFGTIAYLQDTDSDVNVMTLGNVDIVQNEEQRVDPSKSGTLTAEDLEEFDQAKPIYPYVDENLNNAMRDDYEEITFPNGKTHKLFIGDNAIDKFVSVSNVGKSDAYVRTIIALEAPTDKIDLSFNSTDWEMDTTASAYSITVNGVKYDLFVCVYKDILKPETTTPYSLMQISLDWTATNEDAMAYGDTYDVLVLSQAVQTEGFADAQTALDTAFGVVNAENAAAWFEEDDDLVIPEVMGSYEDLTSARGESGNYVIAEDMDLDDFVYFGENTDVEIDLNGKTLTAQNKEQYVFVAQNSELTLTGDGTVEMGKGFYASSSGKLTVNGGTFQMGEISDRGTIFCQNSATVIINDGQFITSDSNTPILYCINGFIEINGGFFQNTANPNQALLSMGNNLNYINNQKITLRGGTFVNWNPMDSAFARPWTNPVVPALIVLDDGYQMISETQANGDVWYSVVPE